MGAISVEQFLPAYLLRPDDSSPISAWAPPENFTAMCVGFHSKPGSQIVFEGETPIQFRLTERTWRYHYLTKNSEVQIINSWRLEVVVDSAGPVLRPGHSMVLVQEPYGLNWIQSAKFKMYSKKSGDERQDEVVPSLNKNDHPIAWLERNMKQDPWETGAHYVAGIGFPNGFHQESQNRNGKFVFGACPDFAAMVAAVFEDQEVKEMLRLTEENRIRFWYGGADLETEPRLYDTVRDEAESLMWRAIEQALAGPSDPAEEWTGQPVSKLVRRIYCAHLNNMNKREALRLQREVPYENGVSRHETPQDHHREQ